MSRRTGVVGVLAAVLVTLPGVAVGAGGGLTWNGYRGVHPGEALSVAAGHLGNALADECDAHRLASGPVLIDDRASGGDGRASSITTTSKRVKGPDGVHVGMSDSAVLAALGPRARSTVVAGHRVRLLKGPHHRALWMVASGTSRRAKVTTMGLSPSTKLARRAAALTVSGCPAAPTPPPPTTPPPPCPAPLPPVGPYMADSCDPATGVVAYTCTSADWLNQNADPADGCEREVEGLVPMTFSTADGCSRLHAALSLHDRIAWGQYPLDASYGCACLIDDNDCGPNLGVWHEPGYDGIRTTPVVPHCSPDTAVDPSFDCTGGVPADPAPLVALDLNQHPGDIDPVVVTPQTVDSDHLTISARVSTQSPIAFDIAFGGENQSCSLSVQSTNGSTPLLKLDLDLVRGADQAGPPVVQNVALTQLENSDLSVTGGFVCSVLPLGQLGPKITAYLTDVLQAWADDFLTQWCGAPDPYWWQDCPAS